MPVLSATRLSARRVLLAAAPLLAVGAPAAHAQLPYGIPADNPFVSTPGARAEIYAYGLRNPWRFSFDRATSALLIGDVGGGQREEVNWIGAAAARGRTFGWPCREGKLGGPPLGAGHSPCPSPPPPYVEPLFDYQGSAITGGFVVRDPGLPALTGRYLFADHYDGQVRSLALNPANPDEQNTGLVSDQLSSFGEDAGGRLYITDLNNGTVQRLVPRVAPAQLGSQALSGSFASPMAVAAVPGDPARIVVLERAGRLRLVVNGVANSDAFLDFSSLEGGIPVDGERGALSVALAPEYASSGKLYVYYTGSDGDIFIDEFTRSDPGHASLASRRPLLRIEHSSQMNHNGGQLQFGADGCLWITTGDGGGQADQLDNAQNLSTLLGKLLRIDPDSTATGTPVCGGLPGVNLPPPPTPQAGDRTAPRLRTRVPPRQRVLRLRGAVAYAGCNEACTIVAAGVLRVGKRRLWLAGVRRVARASQAGRRLRLKVGLKRKQARILRRALRRGRRPTVRLSLRATDPAGNRSPLTRHTVRVRRR